MTRGVQPKDSPREGPVAIHGGVRKIPPEPGVAIGATDAFSASRAEASTAIKKGSAGTHPASRALQP